MFSNAQLHQWAVDAGVLYVVLALAVWSMLAGSANAGAVRLWAAGSIAMGVGLALTPRVYGGGWFYLVGAPALLTSSSVLRIMALRIHLARPLKLPSLVGWWLLAAAGNAACMLSADQRLRLSFNALAYCVGSAAFGWQAAMAGRQLASRAAWMVAGSAATLSAALAVRVASVWWVAGPTVRAPASLDYALLFLIVAVTAIYGNLGYLGLVLDSTHLAAAKARQDHQNEAGARATAEASAAELRALLHDRDRLTEERRHLLHLMAHEVRQPLHTVGGSLQATAQVLTDRPEAQALEALRRLDRARKLLGDVHSVLDNTLTTAVTLLGDEPLAVQEIDLDVMVNLTLADLQDAQRARVSTEWRTDLRSAELEPGLVRLALRNLLNNALRHAGPEATITLRIEERRNPPLLVWSVLDDGPGMPGGAEQAQALARGKASAPAVQGLGLRVVREVAHRHGGQLELAAIQPHGLRASLVLPLPE